jgi:indolepyruvate ferredoxin oxidoreductase, beta subunit
MRELAVYLIGVGGQGVLTMAELLMAAAEEQGLPVNYFPTKGMAQRGGFVKAQLKFGQELAGPTIRPRGADVAIAMELSESLKALRYLKPGGDLIVYSYHWQPTEVMLGRARYPAKDEVAAAAAQAGVNFHYLDPDELPAGTADNIYLLAAALRLSPLGQLIDAHPLRNAIVKRWPKSVTGNLASFEAGLIARE